MVKGPPPGDFNQPPASGSIYACDRFAISGARAYGEWKAPCDKLPWSGVDWRRDDSASSCRPCDDDRCIDRPVCPVIKIPVHVDNIEQIYRRDACVRSSVGLKRRRKINHRITSKAYQLTLVAEAEAFFVPSTTTFTRWISSDMFSTTRTI